MVFADLLPRAVSLPPMNGQPAAGWYADPSTRHELRYWDGGQWTEHVTSQGRPGVDPLARDPAVPVVDRASKKIQRDVRRAGLTADAEVGGGTLLTEQVLVVSQKAKLFERKAEYVVFNQQGQRIGAVQQLGQGLLKRAVGAGQRTLRFQVIDADGRVLMVLTRPAKIVRSKVVVRDGNGFQIGEIAQKNLGIIGKVRFDLQAGGRTVGSINAESMKAWDFNIQDASGDEVARITKTWAGMAKEMFTKGDKYVVQIHRPLEEPLRSLVTSAAVAVDTVLKQGGNRRNRH